MPSVDWSSSSAYLRSCHEWLDAMERWRADALPRWIEATRMALLEHALRHPENPLVIPDPRTATRKIPENPLTTVTEMRLPALD